MHHHDNALTSRVIGCAIEVHRTLGPGLLESIYEAALSYELAQAGVPYRGQYKLPVLYKGHSLDCDYRIDLLVEEALVVEVKAVQQILPVHEAQLLTYMRLSNAPLGLLLNFNELMLKQGIRRRVL